jgi:CRP-like cAMP-binding protein
VRVLAPLFTTARFAPDEVIFQQGAPATHLYVLEQGEIALRLNPEDGGSITIATVQPLGVFGWSAMLGRERYNSGAVCVAEAQVMRLEGTALRRLVRDEPRLGRLLLGRLALALAGRMTAADAGVRVSPALLTRLIQAGMASAAHSR